MVSSLQITYVYKLKDWYKVSKINTRFRTFMSGLAIQQMPRIPNASAALTLFPFPHLATLNLQDL